MARVREYADTLGEDPSPGQLSIIHDTVKTEFYVEEKEAYLDSLKTRIRKGREHPIMEARRRDRAHIRENVKLLGLKRVVRVLTLQELLEQDDSEGKGDIQGDALPPDGSLSLSDPGASGGVNKGKDP